MNYVENYDYLKADKKLDSAVKSLEKAVNIATKLGIDTRQIEHLKDREIKRLQKIYYR
jgi:LPS O-antigen subunit length determinant protein (WzzB/FepE family)